MYRFFVPVENVWENRIRVSGDDVNHIKNVLRMTAGEKVIASCGRGNDYYCEIEKVCEDHVELIVLEEKEATTELPVAITLFQALPKQDKMELVVQKAIELGAVSVVQVRTKRCVVKLDDAKAIKKCQRWQGIAEAAAKQSGRGIVPKIGPVVSFAEALEQARTMDMAMIPYEMWDDMAGSVKLMKKAADQKSIAIFIGPEGGFERGEIEKAMEMGVQPISLGKRILRTETAGMATLSMLMFLIEGREE